MIKQLDEHVINQIAAGEVIERPASVMKELVENSLDAGATMVETNIERGGTLLIRAADDGLGMSKADALLCFERHATSKIDSARDLFSVSSLGFRGEALASIAAVARVELETADREDMVGTRVLVAGGRMEEAEDVVRVPGTTIAVRHLFYNVPVRKGFLRSKEGETRAVMDVLFKLAVARPGVGFRLFVDGRDVWNYPAASDLQARLHQLLGSEKADKFLPVQAVLPGIEIEGWVQPPGGEGRGRRQQVVVINGRPAESPAIRAALAAAFRGAIREGSRLQGYLLVNIEPDKVDVNVHPAKREVRFRDPGRITSTLISAIRRAVGEAGPGLVETLLKPSTGLPRSHGGDYSGPGQGVGFRKTAEDPSLWEFSSNGKTKPGTGEKLDLKPEDVPLMQIASTYIVSQLGDSLVVFDQHTCHERILYEETLRALSGAVGMAQQLLFPFTVDLSPKEVLLAEEFQEEFRQVGFGMRRFGDNTFIVEAVPADLGTEVDEHLVKEVIAGLGEEGGAMANRHHRVAASIACHSAIRAGEKLNEETMRRLIDRLLATEMPHACPHGRPTFIQITRHELERRFFRA